MSPVLGFFYAALTVAATYHNFTISSIICELVLDLAKMSLFFSKSRIPSATDDRNDAQ
jgi:hypothetical protein